MDNSLKFTIRNSINNIKICFRLLEEILQSSQAIWMSKDGHMMLYASFNDSLVEEMHISWFGAENKNLYPETLSLRYPRPGTPNPQVKLHVADLADPKNINIKTVKPPAILEHT